MPNAAIQVQDVTKIFAGRTVLDAIRLDVIEGETLPDVSKICEVSLATVKRRIAEAEEIIDRRLRET